MIDEPLIEARIDRDRVGENWPDAIAMLIEAHESHRCKSGEVAIATRKQARVLAERYAARYFPDEPLTIEARRRINALLRKRWMLRYGKACQRADRQRFYRDLQIAIQKRLRRR